MSIKLAAPPEESTTWAFLSTSALWYHNRCVSGDNSRIRLGTMRTGLTGGIEISVARTESLGGGKTIDGNASRTLSNADSVDTS